MTISDIFSKERNQYQDSLISTLKTERLKCPEAVSEVLIEINTEKIARPYRFIRPDVLVPDNPEPKIIEVNKSEYFSFVPISAHLDSGISLAVFPFHWNAFEVRLFGSPPTWTPLEEWIHQWMDLNDSRYREGIDFMNVVHGVTTPENHVTFWQFSIDMGSADIEAVSALFAIFSALEVTRVEIGSFSMIPSPTE